MQIIHRDIKKGQLKVKIENLDDLWYLSTIIDEGDILKSKTQRKIKLGGAGENAKVIIKTILISIHVEKVEFHKYYNILRVSGKVEEGTEDVAKGVYHTFSLEPNVLFSLQKEKFLSFQVDKLNEAEQQKPSSILICVFDREEATFAILKKYGYEILTELKGNVMKKDNPEKLKNTFYKDIVQQLHEYDQRFKLTKIVLGSPAFWKEYLLAELVQDKLKEKVLLASCNNTGRNGITEVLKRQEVVSALKDDRIIKEINLVNDLKTAIATNEKSAYGIKDVLKAAEAGAIRLLLVTDTYIHKLREEGKYTQLDKIMKLVDTMNGDIHIISSDHDGGRELDGLGGAGALLRYKL